MVLLNQDRPMSSLGVTGLDEETGKREPLLSLSLGIKYSINLLLDARWGFISTAKHAMGQPIQEPEQLGFSKPGHHWHPPQERTPCGGKTFSLLIILATPDMSVGGGTGAPASLLHTLPGIPEQPRTRRQASLGFTFPLCKAMGCLEPREGRLKLTEGQASNGEWKLGSVWADMEGRDLDQGVSASPPEII